MELKCRNGPEECFIFQSNRLEKADVAILPVPYDATASYVKGTRLGPRAIIDASLQLEDYDLELGTSICDRISIATLEELDVSEKSPEEMVADVEDAVKKIVGLGKKPVVLGGEHSITAGAVNAFRGEKFSVLQIDAHSDLRDSYEESRYNHACAMRRCREVASSAVQVGIRAMSEEEAGFVRENGLEKSMFFAHEFHEGRIKEIISQLEENVYVSVDVDGFDPSVMPGTGTPQPGGLKWHEVLKLMKEVGKQKKVIGFDITEVVPVPPIPVTEFAAATLAYKMMGYFWASR